jgi:hypothetical protein
MVTQHSSDYKRMRQRPNRFQGIDSTSLCSWRAGISNRVVVPALQVENRFLDSFKIFTNTGSGLRPSKVSAAGVWKRFTISFIMAGKSC